MGAPYRDPETQWFQTFAQHVGIAEGCLEDLGPLLRRFEASLPMALEINLSELELQIGTAWEAVWNQLDQARALAAKHGRDVAAFDRARAEVRDRSVGAVRSRVAYRAPTEFPRGQQLVFSASGPAIVYYLPEAPLARTAAAALRTAVPEVVIPEAPKTTIAATPWWVVWGPMLLVTGVLVLVGALAVYFVTRH